jgi:hypothetical protein
VTMITISDQDPRSIKAVEIAAGAGQWLKCRTTDGRKAYGIQSQCQADRYYFVDCSACTCPDAARNAGQACKHQLAVRLHCALVKGAQTLPRRRTAFVASHVDAAGHTVYLPARGAPMA